MTTTLVPDRDFIVRTLVDLVRINSVNPSLSPDGAGEAEIGAYVAKALASLGLETATYEPQPGRTTAVGTLRGTGGGRSLMLNAHADTVGVDEMADPFGARIRDGRLYGRGAHDMKGSLAAGIGAAKMLADAGVRLRGDLVVAAVADEEYGSLGTADLITRIKTDAAIVTEPTNLDVCLAHKGYIWIDVETHGKAAHGSRFTEGVDAVMRMGRFLAELERLEVALRTGRAHPLVGPPSLHAATINGGSGLSTYAAQCRLQIRAAHGPWRIHRGRRRPDPRHCRPAGRRGPDLLRHGAHLLRTRAVRSRARRAHRPRAGGRGSRGARADAGVRRRHALDGRRAARRGRHRDGRHGSDRRRRALGRRMG